MVLDLAGKKFNKLTPIKKVGKNKQKLLMWECRCDCGNMCIVSSHNIVSGKTKSCGCYRKEARKNIVYNGNLKHGLYGTRIYRIYSGMMTRCYNKNALNYKWYGRKGIEVCKEWRDDFLLFYQWAMKSGYKDDLTLDRIDNSKGYNPSNCRWVSNKDQHLNTTKTIYVEYEGKKYPLIQLCAILNFSYGIAKQRKRHGWSDEVLFKEKGYRYKNSIKKNAISIKYKGKIRRLTDVCSEIGFNYNVARNRKFNGWPDERLFDKVGSNYFKHGPDPVIKIKYNNAIRPLTDVCREIGFDYKVAAARIKYGWPEDILFSPVGYKYSQIKGGAKPSITIMYFGEERFLKEVCNEIGFSYGMAFDRRSDGWPDEFLFMPKGFSYKRYLKEQEKKALPS